MIERLEQRTFLSSYFLSAAGSGAADGSPAAP